VWPFLFWDSVTLYGKNSASYFILMLTFQGTNPNLFATRDANGSFLVDESGSEKFVGVEKP
jgi:hypothetical protein